MKNFSRFVSLFLALVILLTPVAGNMSVIANAANEWICAWSTSVVDSSISVANVNVQDIIPAKSTIRIELKVTTGGEMLRFKFSNQYGAAALTINDASVAKTSGAGEAKILKDTASAITFNGGNKSITIPKGSTVWSDPVEFETEALDALSVSLFFENLTYITTAGLSNARTFLGIRNIFRDEDSQCYNESVSAAREINITASTITYHTTPFLCEVDTYVKSGSKDVAVFIGDSTLVNNTYLYFAEKLVKAGITNVSVINQAIVGNKLLSDGTGLIGKLYGDALIDRFERDALNVSGVKYVFVKVGLNDILHQFSKSMGADVPHYSAREIINGYKKLVDMAHAKGIKIYFFTKTPWKGYERAFLGQSEDIVWSQEMQDMCDELTDWIKTNKLADGYIDCSPLANPADEDALCPSFTSDGAHLTALAAVALADLIPVSYVGVNKELKSVASRYGVDPYKEKKQIIYDLEHPEEKTTQKVETTTKKEEPTTKKEETTTKKEQPTTSAPVTEDTTVQQYIPQEIITVPVIGTEQETQIYENDVVTPDYNITDTEFEELGNGKPLAFLLVLFTVIVIAGAVLFLTLGRKKQEEFE